jgi:DNA (cytosine-5)-methyltransferase 1
MKSTKKQKYNIVDLFAGAGGLSYGFLQTGRFQVKAAFENNKNAQRTYRRNHGGTDIYDDVADALSEEIKQQLGQVDVVIGGPPCQGFSNANRQKNHAVSQNNSLVKKFVQAVLHLNPTAFVMENVSMLQSNVHRFYVDENDDAVIKKYSIDVKEDTIVLLDSTYLFEGVAEIVSDIDAIDRYLWSEDGYLVLNVIFKNRSNSKKLIAAMKKHEKKLLDVAGLLVQNSDENAPILQQDRIAGCAIQSYFTSAQTDADAKALFSAIESSIMFQRMLSKAREIINNKIRFNASIQAHGLVAEVKSMSVIDYIESILGSDETGYAISKGVLSAASFGAPQKRMRFVVLGVKKEKVAEVSLPIGSFEEDSFRTVRDAISDIERVDTTSDVAIGDLGVALDAPTANISELGRSLRDSEHLYNHVSTATTPEALKRFKVIKQGGNFHTLADDLKTSYSDPTRTQNTIYLRLNYDEPSGTVVNVRKSMWIHPVKHRALSIREAARLQTFPDSFVFCGTKDSQYQQVGNAVPPVLARAIAEQLCRYLDG